HVQQAQEADAESEAERAGHLRLIVQRGIIETQLRERIAEALVVLGVDGEQTREHPRLDLFETRQALGALPVFQSDGVAYRRAIHLLDAGDDETDIAGGQLAQHDRFRREAPELVGRVAATRGHDSELVPGLQTAVDDPDQRYDADIVVEPRVNDQRLQR